MKQKFQKIYEQNLWQGGESRSGPGSSMVATAAIRCILPWLFRELGVQTLFDIPCGDFNWMRELLREMPGILYFGADIVPDLIRENQQTALLQQHFSEMDIVKDSLIPADLILVRDLLVHFDQINIEMTLRSIAQNSYKYVLMTHFTDPRTFLDTKLGCWRPINFCLPPFGLSQPLMSILEGNAGHPDKTLSLWAMNEFRKAVMG